MADTSSARYYYRKPPVTFPVGGCSPYILTGFRLLWAFLTYIEGQDYAL